MENRKFKIWYRTYDEEGNVTGTGVCTREYCHYGTACNVAHKRFGDQKNIDYEVAVLNPFEEHFQDAVCDLCGKTHSRLINATFGRVFEDHYMYITSSAIAPEDGRKRFHKYHRTCPDCIVKIKNFIDSLKECQKRKTDRLVEYKYEVDVGSGCGTGSVFVPESATDDEILLKIMHDLYDVSYEKVQKEGKRNE